MLDITFEHINSEKIAERFSRYLDQTGEGFLMVRQCIFGEHST